MQQKLNISEKAYARLTSHIRNVFSFTGQGKSRAERAIRALNEYIEGSRHDFDDILGVTEVQLALMMLQPEIDRCLARSAAARARARARKEARELQKQRQEADVPQHQPEEDQGEGKIIAPVFRGMGVTPCVDTYSLQTVDSNESPCSAQSFLPPGGRRY